MGASFNPLYTSIDSVKVRLANKVQFQSSPNGPVEGELPDALLWQLIADAETEVERDLCYRYAIPFSSIAHGSYANLPDHSKRAIRMVVDMKAVWLILNTDFGRGGNVDASKYADQVGEQYDKSIAKLLGRDPEAKGDPINRYRHAPPLPDVVLAKGNNKADDGFRGMPINTDSSRGGPVEYAEHQINDPSKSWNRRGPFGLR